MYSLKSHSLPVPLQHVLQKLTIMKESLSGLQPDSKLIVSYYFKIKHLPYVILH
jgi:hypothetical protein